MAKTKVQCADDDRVPRLGSLTGRVLREWV